MGKHDIYELLKENGGRWYSSEEIGKFFKICQNTAGRSLSKMCGRGIYPYIERETANNLAKSKEEGFPEIKMRRLLYFYRYNKEEKKNEK